MTKIDAKTDDDLLVEGEGEDEEVVHSFDIAAYPSDLTLSVIYEMWGNKDIVIPEFQRNFVWTISQASLLIDSFLQGLPVPQLFFYVDDSNKSIVIDGQQRILSVIYFFEGFFGNETTQGKKQVFRLTGFTEDSPYANKTFEELGSAAQRKLKSSVLRAINIRQLRPLSEDPTSIYHIFERLSTGGTPLKAQEIRNCSFRGPIVTYLRRLNDNENWREILGRKHLDRHQKDVELVLRLLSLTDQVDKYEKPMKEYLNTVMAREVAADSEVVKRFEGQFFDAARLIVTHLGPKPFHARGPLNSSILDAVFCTVASNPDSVKHDLKTRFDKLLRDEEFKVTTYISTSDKRSIEKRFQLARQYLLDK